MPKIGAITSSSRKRGRKPKRDGLHPAERRARDALRLAKKRLRRAELAAPAAAARRTRRSGGAAALLALRAELARSSPSLAAPRLHVAPSFAPSAPGLAAVSRGAGVFACCAHCRRRRHCAQRVRKAPGPLALREEQWVARGTADALNCPALTSTGAGRDKDESSAAAAVSRGQMVGWYTGAKAEPGASGDYVLFVRGTVEGAPGGADFCIDARTSGSIMRFLNGASKRSAANVEFSGPVRVFANGLIGVRVVGLRAVAAHNELEVYCGSGFDFRK
jgi:hypothetical protein